MTALIITALITLAVLCLIGAAALLVMMCNEELTNELIDSKINNDHGNH